MTDDNMKRAADDMKRAADALKKAKQNEQQVALASANSFLVFLEKVGLRVTANIISDFIKQKGWAFVKCFVKGLLGTADFDPDCF